MYTINILYIICSLLYNRVSTNTTNFKHNRRKLILLNIRQGKASSNLATADRQGMIMTRASLKACRLGFNSSSMRCYQESAHQDYFISTRTFLEESLPTQFLAKKSPVLVFFVVTSLTQNKSKLHARKSTQTQYKKTKFATSMFD